MDLIELRSDQLHVGLSLRYSLRDETGTVLLAKGQTIEAPAQLDAIKARQHVYIEQEEAEEGVRVMMSGMSALDKADAPLKDFSKYVNIKKTAAQEKPADTLVQLWGDLESRLTGLLASVGTTTDFQSRMYAIDQTMVELQAQDLTVAQFLLFYRSVTHFEGYSVMHSLLCASLVSTLADVFKLSEVERRSLACAALSMNVAMTQLQNHLAVQKTPPNPLQRRDIDAHPAAGYELLKRAGVTDSHWLALVAKHHAALQGPAELSNWAMLPRMCRILQTVDRYTAAMSPRKSRSGRTARDSVRSVVIQAGASKHDEVGTALVKILGLSPPGTFVRLSNGETAVVMQPRSKPGEPVVASVLNRAGDPIAEPRLHDTSREVKVEATLAATEVRVNLNLEAMVRLMSRIVLPRPFDF